MKLTWQRFLYLLPALMLLALNVTFINACSPINFCKLINGRVNVVSCGATGDGLTDDTAAIQKAFDILRKTGGTLFFPAGDYLLRRSLHANVDDLNFLGEGPSKSIIIFDPPNEERYKMAIWVQKHDDSVPPAGTAPNKQYTESVVVEALGFKVRNGAWQSVSKSTQSVIQFNSCKDCKITDVSIFWDKDKKGPVPDGLDGIGVAIDSQKILIERTEVEEMGKTGVWISWASDVTVNHLSSNNNGAGGLGIGRVEHAKLEYIETHGNVLLGVDIGSMGFAYSKVRGVAKDITMSHVTVSGNGLKCYNKDDGTRRNDYYWCAPSITEYSPADTAGVRIGSGIDEIPTDITIEGLESFENYDFGLQIQAGERLLIVEPELHHNVFGGISIESNIIRLLESVEVQSPRIYNNNTAENPSVGGISLGRAKYVSIIGGKVFDDHIPKTQTKGILLAPKVDNSINNLRIENVEVRTDDTLANSYYFKAILDDKFTVKKGHYHITHPNRPTEFNPKLSTEIQFPAPLGSVYIDSNDECEFSFKENGWVLVDANCK